MKRLFTLVLLLMMLGMSSMALTGCEREEPADTIEEVGDELEDVTDEID